MSRGKILFILACTVFVLALVGVGIALQRHIDTAAEQDIRAAEARNAANATQSADTAIDYYVGGKVRNPGFYKLPTEPRPTLGQALLAAGGASTDTAAATSVQLIRKAGDQTETHSVPLADLLAGRHDEPLQPGDVINVVKQIDATTLPASERLLPIAPTN
jgi:hypothetical protein